MLFSLHEHEHIAEQQPEWNKYIHAAWKRRRWGRITQHQNTKQTNVSGVIWEINKSVQEITVRLCFLCGAFRITFSLSRSLSFSITLYPPRLFFFFLCLVCLVPAPSICFCLLDREITHMRFLSLNWIWYEMILTMVPALLNRLYLYEKRTEWEGSVKKKVKYLKEQEWEQKIRWTRDENRGDVCS